MWKSFAHWILSNRIICLFTLVVLVGLMGFLGTRLQLSYQIARVLPLSDSTQVEYERFKERFGADGTLMVIGWKNPRWFDLKIYQAWYDLSNELKGMNGVKETLSTARLYNLTKNDSGFVMQPLLTHRPNSQAEADTLEKQVLNLPFYEGLIYNPQTKANLMAITFNEKVLNSKERIAIVENIRQKGKVFTEKTGIELHYSGMPAIRTEVMKKVSHEMTLFLALAAAVTGLMVWLLFRSWRIVLISLLVVGMGVCVTLGTLALFGYEITMLTGMLPPLLMVIGVPNCVFLVNHYQDELREHGNQQRALENIIRKVGISALLANVTTAIGFGVFYFTNSRLLMEFGVVAAICILAVYAISMVMVPVLLSYMPAMVEKESESKWMPLLSKIDFWVRNRRSSIYITILIVTLIAGAGLYFVNVQGYVVDDLPQNDPVYTDLRFFEKEFQGALPMEVSIDTGHPNGVFDEGGRTLYKIRSLERIISQYPDFSKGRSVVDGIRYVYQAYRGGKSRFFVLLPLLELQKLADHLPDSGGQSALLKTYLDSTRRYTRVSYQMADVGSHRIKEVMTSLQPRIDSIFASSGDKVHLTGHSLVFLKSNDYLLGNLYESLGIAILLIALVGMILFRSVPIILLSKLPCLIPLLVTAGIMGYTGIPFKPSTILVFSIAFGLSSDGTVYFLTSYRRFLGNGMEPYMAISAAIRETGVSLIHTALILAGGFAVFAFSSFGGTAALGILVSTTVLMACITNLVLLPALMLSLKRYQV
ncbi:MAG: MMPL family transporter [Siphonobacter sp.]